MPPSLSASAWGILFLCCLSRHPFMHACVIFDSTLFTTSIDHFFSGLLSLWSKVKLHCDVLQIHGNGLSGVESTGLYLSYSLTAEGFIFCLMVAATVVVAGGLFCSWVVSTWTCSTSTRWWVRMCRLPSRPAARTSRNSRWSRAWGPSRRRHWNSSQAGSAVAATHRLWVSINQSIN